MTTGRAAILHRASLASKSASANVGALVMLTDCKGLEELAKSNGVTDAWELATVIGEVTGPPRPDSRNAYRAALD